MGRLFWKFFFFIWLAQLCALIGASTIFFFERKNDEARWLAERSADVQGRSLPGGPIWLPPHPPPHFEKRVPFQHPPGPLPDHLRLIPLVPLLATLLASLIFAALLAWYFAKPIRHLREALAEAASGNLDVRLDPRMGRRRDELADLGRDFDRMASQLQALMEGQRRLLHDVSHEMRSPLARLQAAIGLLHKQPENLTAAIERIERESVRMDRLVGELLTLSRLEAGGEKTNEDIQLGELLNDIAQDACFEAEAQNRHVALQVEGDPVVRGNAVLLQRAVENVVRNAIRHTPENSVVQLACRLERGRVCVSICDAGPGVSEARLEDIFEPFFRAHAGTDGDGHGLGLAIAKRVVTAHGGSIRARNRAEGGFCVEIELPVMN